MSTSDWPSLPAMFLAQADRLASRPLAWAKERGTYRPWTWSEVREGVLALARGLESVGVGPGDRIVLVAENRPEWLIADLAIMAIGALTVPAYTTNTEEDHLHILENSGAKGVIVSTARLSRTVIAAALRTADTCFVVTMDPAAARQQYAGVDLFSWDEIRARGHSAGGGTAQMAAGLARTDPACIIYTSGTGGAPRGVVLTHGNILHNCAGAADALADFGLENEVYLSFLPLSHAYEHTAGQFFPLTIAAQIYYAEGVDTLAANLREARPTIMTAVPRLYDTLYQRILRGVRKQSRLRRALFEKTVALGERRARQPGSLTLIERMADACLDYLVRRKIQGFFGGRLKALVSGGAPLNPDIGYFFTALGVQILQGYGQTEAAPVISVNRPGRAKMHTVGPPLKDTEVSFADDGEILVRGELVMPGYWRNAEATAAVLRDGWLHTGDIGAMDEDGHLIITDRKKDIIVNSGGDNISPARVEGFLTMQPEVAQAMVYGDRRPHLVALIVPDDDWLKSWAAANGKAADLAALAEDGDLIRALSQVMDRVNRTLSPIEKIRRIAIAREPFSLANEQITPTLKIRRHVIRNVYGAALERLYG